MSLRRQAGFTLLEVIAAAVIFALVFATTLQIISGSLRNVSRSADYTEAALWAESRLVSLGIDPPLEEGRHRGRFNDEYEWEMEIVRFEVEADEANADLSIPHDPTSFEQLTPVDLYLVDLTVTWGEDGRRGMTLSTLRSLTPVPE